MKIAMIGCPFRTTYGYYIESLKHNLESSGSQVSWVASNCGCGDPIEIARDFQTKDLVYFDVPNEIGPFNLLGFPAHQPQRVLKTPFRSASFDFRLARYEKLTAGSDIVHLQQTLAAYGSNSAFRLLKKGLGAARVVTVHELDPEQSANPELNHSYNLSDAVIVHDVLMKEKLVSQGVLAELVHVVCWGTDLADFDEPVDRKGIVFYGGHNLNKGKGLDVLLHAYKTLKDNAKVSTPPLRIHGHFGAPTSEFLSLVSQLGLDGDVEWLGDLSNEKIVALYRQSQVCVLPYAGSFAGLPAGFAAANRLPVIATRLAGIPGHIGELGIWINGRDPEELAARLQQVLSDERMRAELGVRLRTHALQNLSWKTIADNTADIYRLASDRAALRHAC